MERETTRNQFFDQDLMKKMQEYFGVDDSDALLKYLHDTHLAEEE